MWSLVYAEVKQHWGSFENSVAYKKSVQFICMFKETSYYLKQKHKCW